MNLSAAESTFSESSQNLDSPKDAAACHQKFTKSSGENEVKPRQKLNIKQADFTKR